MRRVQTFTNRIKALYDKRDAEARDLRPEELSTMFDSFLGNNYDKRKKVEVAKVQRELHEEQERIVGKFHAGDVNAEEYLAALNSMIHFAFVKCERILGTKDFKRLFGATSANEKGFIDRSVFLEGQSGSTRQQFKDVVDKAAIRILVADDHAAFRSGVHKLLDPDAEMSIVGEAQSGDECVRMLSKLKPDILLLDLHMPDKDGLAVLKKVDFDTLPTRVIILTAVEDDHDVVRAMRLGASGVVLKQSANDLLVKSIHRAHAGEIWLDNRMATEMMKVFSKSSRSVPRREKPLLSDREKEIIQLVAQGFRNKEIGEKLLISEQTVKSHLHSVFDKLGVSDLHALTLYVMQRGLTERQ